MQIVLMRHCVTDYNSQGRFQSEIDIPLNNKGIDQASDLAARLRPEWWTKVYSSNLVRASQTAEIIATKLGINRAEITELKERNLGILDGQLSAEYSRKYPDEALRLREDLDFAPCGGETRRDALNRFLIGLRKAVRDAADSRSRQAILVVTHGGVIDILIQQILREWTPGSLIDNGNAVSVHIEDISVKQIPLVISRFNVRPDECERLNNKAEKGQIDELHDNPLPIQAGVV